MLQKANEMVEEERTAREGAEMMLAQRDQEADELRRMIANVSEEKVGSYRLVEGLRTERLLLCSGRRDGA